LNISILVKHSKVRLFLQRTVVTQVLLLWCKWRPIVWLD